MNLSAIQSGDDSQKSTRQRRSGMVVVPLVHFEDITVDCWSENFQLVVGRLVRGSVISKRKINEALFSKLCSRFLFSFSFFAKLPSLGFIRLGLIEEAVFC